MACKIRPLHELLIVRVITSEKKTAGGIVLPETASEDQPLKGTVLAAGSGRLLSDGSLYPLEVKEGDTVLFERFSGMKVKYEEEEVLFLREDEIMAVVCE